MKTINSPILSGLMGLCVADALGVPVEFRSRETRIQDPVTDMRGYETYNQPPGTWSDDSSLTFCLVEAICSEGLSSNKLLEVTAHNFCRWYFEDWWTPYGVVFDVGGTTADAIELLKQGVAPIQAGGKEDLSNGNGSLMRILPLAFGYRSLEFSQLIELVHQTSCLTHAHPRSQIACGFYISMAVCLLEGKKTEEAYLQGIDRVKDIYRQAPYLSEMIYFTKFLSRGIGNLPIEEISSSGYVIDTLIASTWCLLTTSNYIEAVLKAVNLGDDTDTTAAVTGGLAGIYYGLESIPLKWQEKIARKNDVIDLAKRLEQKLAIEI
jgi:ADP-ribosyl-[dinitrogen reductase] hydrolase